MSGDRSSNPRATAIVNWDQYLGGSCSAAELREKLRRQSFGELLEARQNWPEVGVYLNTELGPFLTVETILGGGFVTFIVIPPQRRRQICQRCITATDIDADISSGFLSALDVKEGDIIILEQQKPKGLETASYRMNEFVERKLDGTEGDPFFFWLLEVVRPRKLTISSDDGFRFLEENVACYPSFFKPLEHLQIAYVGMNAYFADSDISSLNTLLFSRLGLWPNLLCIGSPEVGEDCVFMAPDLIESDFQDHARPREKCIVKFNTLMMGEVYAAPILAAFLATIGIKPGVCQKQPSQLQQASKGPQLQPTAPLSVMTERYLWLRALRFDKPIEEANLPQKRFLRLLIKTIPDQLYCSYKRQTEWFLRQQQQQQNQKSSGSASDAGNDSAAVMHLPRHCLSVLFDVESVGFTTTEDLRNNLLRRAGRMIERREKNDPEERDKPPRLYIYAYQWYVERGDTDIRRLKLAEFDEKCTDGCLIPHRDLLSNISAMFDKASVELFAKEELRSNAQPGGFDNASFNTEQLGVAAHLLLPQQVWLNSTIEYVNDLQMAYFTGFRVSDRRIDSTESPLSNFVDICFKSSTNLSELPTRRRRGKNKLC